MFFNLHRILPFLGGRGRDGGPSSRPAGSEPALVGEGEQQLSMGESDNNSNDWHTLSRNNEPSDETQRTDGGLKRPQRLIGQAVSQMRLRARDEYLVDDDISRGREHHKLPAVSYKRGDKPPLDFHYVVDHIQRDPIQLERSLATMASCLCEDDCSDGRCNCASGHQQGGRFYNSKGRLHESYNLDSPPVIYECNAACKCNRKRCKNMVIQGGCKHRLMLFRTKSRGWGVRTLEHLKRGTFVGLYSGELVSAKDSAFRQDDTYLFNLSSTQIYYPPSTEQAASSPTSAGKEEATPKLASEEAEEDIEESVTINSSDGGQQGEEEAAPKEQQQEQQSDSFVCDAKFYGNFTRFVNHSCNPNVIGIRSFTSHQDHKFPHIAFFTNKDVPANTELTLNYGDNYWLVKCKRDSCYCLCKQPNCRFNKKNFASTLERHKRQKQA